MNRDDGGPAFPHGLAGPEGVYLEQGMSLRDWFAGQALPSVILATSQGLHDPAGKHGKGVAESIVLDAYEMADAMLKAREQHA